jgi:hypothetical protein
VSKIDYETSGVRRPRSLKDCRATDDDDDDDDNDDMKAAKENAYLLIGKAGGTYTYHWALGLYSV